jgi:hypothetical protein
VWIAGESKIASKIVVAKGAPFTKNVNDFSSVILFTLSYPSRIANANPLAGGVRGEGVEGAEVISFLSSEKVGRKSHI